MNRIYDMVIIGGGPGGYTAALYAARAGLSVILLEKLSAGGQMALTTQVDNYPGFEDGIDGFELAEKMQAQAERFGTITELAEVTGVRLEGQVKEIDTSEGVFYGRTVVISTGASPRELGFPNEQALAGKGLHYCAACDGMLYKGKTVVVVGGGNSAVADAMVLSRIAEKVILIHRRDTLRADKIYHNSILNAPNIEFMWNSTVTDLKLTSNGKEVTVANTQTGDSSVILCDGVFVSIGRKPASKLVERYLELDDAGYIVADETTKTSLPGVFAVGDVRTKKVRQIVTAVADGATAVHYAEAYLAEV